MQYSWIQMFEVKMDMIFEWANATTFTNFDSH